MPVPTAISQLSQTPGSNSPSGTETVGPVMNQYIQAAFAFIAQLNAQMLPISGGIITAASGTVGLTVSSATGALSPSVVLQAQQGGAGNVNFQSQLRANGATSSFELLNSAGSAVNLSVTDAGALAVKGGATFGQRPTWATYTPWDNNNLTNLNQLTNGPGYQTASGSVASAASAGIAGTLGQNGGATGMTFNWTDKTGTPSRVWGGTDGISFYAYNPANFTVSHATSADTATSASSAGSATYASTAGAVGGTSLPFYSASAGQIAQAWGVGSGYLSVTVNGTSYGITLSPSDARLKENIAPSTEGALAIVNEFQFHSFNFKKDGVHDPDARIKIGFIAQELYALDPNLVIGSPDGDIMMAPNLLNLVATLGKAVQELAAQVEALRKG